ncbi:DUF6477 family protein [Paracoccus marinaquae]|uniref:Uncharacterized protein n=1 Tax=Paracoccus marinaquae TaxID=2841926 RepID=A0ABS6AJ39_9RHOB|nr:DUF6477 family protein [Paracoccus marinaquae]MBU3030236.1 hypothetical protein [Paracoccus marinaquae]
MTAIPNVIVFRSRPPRTGLRRPGALIRAAREGQAGWRRERDLPRLLRAERCPAPGVVLPRLRAEEAIVNEARIERAADYDIRRHVLLMIAILAEMRAAVAMAPQPAATRPGRASSARISAPGTAIPAHP